MQGTVTAIYDIGCFFGAIAAYFIGGMLMSCCLLLFNQNLGKERSTLTEPRHDWTQEDDPDRNNDHECRRYLTDHRVQRTSYDRRT